MNNVSLVGRLTKDVELKYTGSGMAIANFTIAVKRQFKDKTTGEYTSDFINCVAFKNAAEILTNHTEKGLNIGVTGSINTGSYEKADGTKVYTTDVLVNNITLIDKKKNNDNNERKQVFDHDERFKNLNERNENLSLNDKNNQIEEDDLPF